jgi:hypothetical protein
MSSHLLGQQQQSSSSVVTGTWTSPPRAYQLGTGMVFKISAAQGEFYIQVQSGSISVISTMPSGSTTQQIELQPVPAMPTSLMPPMSMGGMKMSMHPMEMRMGSMEMSMGSPAADVTQPTTPQQFCSQCGIQVAPGDRFCSRCGHGLS